MLKMKRALNAAIKQKRFASSRPVRFWVTEFGWDSAPSDPKGVPLELHARWVSEALYRMWYAGVSLVTWYRLRDGPPDGPVQSGLWFRCTDGIACDAPKPSSLKAFRFPFVAFRSGKRHVRVWGRTPDECRRQGRDRALAQGRQVAQADARCARARTACFASASGARARAASAARIASSGREVGRVLPEAAARHAGQPLRFHGGSGR